MPNKIQIKRTSITGRTPNTTNSGNSHYIDTGELALNITDGKLFSSNGLTYFEVGGNLQSLSVTSGLTANSTLVNATALNVVNQTNTATLFVTTSANVASAFLANSTGAYHTGTINAASYTVGTNFTSNSSQLVLNAPSYKVSFSNTNGSAPNYITWSTSLQQAIPTTTTRSLGTKIIFYEGLSGSATDWAYGLAGSEMWASVGTTTGTFRWYAVTTAFMTSNTSYLNHNAQVRVGGGVGTTNGATISNTSISVGNTVTNSSLGVSTLNVGTSFTVNSISVNSAVNTSIAAIIANGSIGTSGQVLTSNATGIYWGTVTGTAANPSGADTQVQFNDGGSAFGATAGFTFNKTTNNVTIANTLIVTAINANGSIGTSGQVLTSNATGIYWSTVSGGGGSGASLAEVRKSVSLRI